MAIFSRTGDTKPVLATVTAEEVADIFRGEGFGPEVTKDSSGEPMLRFKVEGFNCNLFFYGVKDGRAESLQFGIAFADKLSMERVNEWNRSKRFLKAHLGAEGDARVTMDVDLEGGVTRDHLVVCLQTWRSILLSFIRFAGS
jgi:hypothetical protein